MLQKYREIANKVKEIVRKIDPNAKVYVFGSVVKGIYTGASDIDILIVTNKIGLKYKMMVEVYREVEAPVELHIVTENQKKWYMRFIGKDEIERI